MSLNPKSAEPKLAMWKVAGLWIALAASLALLGVMLLVWLVEAIFVAQQLFNYASDHPHWTATMISVVVPTLLILLLVASSLFVRVFEAARWWSRPKRGRLSLPRRFISNDRSAARSRDILGSALRPQRGFAVALAGCFIGMVYFRTTGAGDDASVVLGDFFAIAFFVGLLAGVGAISFSSRKRTSMIVHWMPLVVAAAGFGIAGAFVGAQVLDSLPTQMKDHLESLATTATAKTTFEVLFAVPAATYGIWRELAKVEQRGFRRSDFRSHR